VLVVNLLPNPGWCSFGIDKPHAPLKQFHPSTTFQISLTFQILSRKHYLWGVELLQHPMFIHSPKVDIRSDSVSHSNITELQSFPDNHWLVQGKTQKENRCAHKNLHIFFLYCFQNSMTSHISFGTLLSALHHNEMCASAPAPKAAFQTVGTCW